jgi:tetratricopeptide (TPR) repeat protein
MLATGIGAVLLFASFLFFSYRPSTLLWSLSNGADLAPTARVVWLLFGALALVSPLLLRRAAPPVERRSFSPLARGAAAALLSLLLFTLFQALRSKNHFLGDGWLVITLLERDQDPLTTRPGMGTLLVHRLLLRLVRGHGVGEERLFALLSSAAGVFYVLLVLRWARIASAFLSPKKAPGATWLLAAAPLTIGILQLFFGYVENYGLAHLFLLAFVVEGSIGLVRGKRPIAATLFFLLSVGAHWATAALLPSLIYLWMERGGRIFGRLPKRLLEAGAVLVFLLPTLLSQARLLYPFQPWTALGLYAPYGILSPDYLLLRANFALLLVPVPIVLFLAGRSSAADSSAGVPEGREPLLRFLRAAALSGIALSAAVRAFLGPCDWDLFSFFATPTALWASARALARVNGRRVLPLAALATGLGLFALAPWVIGNTTVRGGAARVARMVHDDKQHYVGRKPRAVALAWVMAERGAPEVAFDLFRHIVEVRPDNAIARSDLGILYWRRGNYREALPHLEEAVRREPMLAPPLYYMGTSLFHLKEGDLGEDALRKFLERTPENPSAEGYLGRVLLLKKQWAEALDHLLVARRTLGDNPDLDTWIGMALLRLDRKEEAKGYLGRALEKDPGHADARRLLGEIGGGDD